MRFTQKIATFAILPLAVIGLPLAAMVFAIQPMPLIEKSVVLDMAEVKQARLLANRFDPRRMPPGKTTTVMASEDELNAILVGFLSGLDYAKARASVTPAGLDIGATLDLPLPANAIGRYLNLRLLVARSSVGLKLSRLAIGRVEVPAILLEPVLKTAIDLLIASGKGDQFVASVRSIDTAGQRVVVRYQPPETLLQDLEIAAATIARAGNPEKVRYYYEEILELSKLMPASGNISLASYLGPIFAVAIQRSRTHHPIDENRSAILALAMYIGDPRFERLIGQVLTPEMRQQRPRADQITLHGRDDWAKHFIISAGLALTGGGRIANLIGAAKEVTDSEGGSGYSFTDLAADRAGVRFAELAIASTESAETFQKKLGQRLSESDFFPQVSDLPENLSQSEFRARYQEIDSQDFRAVVREIDRRIMAIRLYQL